MTVKFIHVTIHADRSDTGLNIHTYIHRKQAIHKGWGSVISNTVFLAECYTMIQINHISKSLNVKHNYTYTQEIEMHKLYTVNLYNKEAHNDT